MRHIALITALCLPAAAIGAGSNDNTAPAPTQTTETCDEGLVFDLATETCLPPEESTNEDSALLQDIRKLAHDGDYATARLVLDALDDQQADLALTYSGFVARKSGDMAGGMAIYRAALAINPDNLLARSYMGQAHVEEGQMARAYAQMIQIEARGGAGTWAAEALANALRTGRGYDH